MQHDDRVIVVGAGPVGAVTALALVKKGIPVTLLEGEAEPPEDQRAATIHPPTVEMLVELGLKDEAFADDASGGLLSPIFHFRDRVTGELVAVFDINLLKGEVPYPFVVQWEQYKLVRAARPHIEGSGIAEVRFSTKMTGLVQSADHVDVTVINDGGETETLRGRYVIGTDGGRSTVRRLAGHRVRGLHLARAFHQDRHQLRFRLDRPGLLHPQLFLRSQRVAQPVQGQRQRPARLLARHHAGAGGRERRAGPEHGRHPAPPAGHPQQARRLRNPVLTRSIPCTSGWPRPSTRAACCSPATARMSTIPSAAWA